MFNEPDSKYLIDNVVSNFTREYDEKVQKKMNFLLRRNLKKPVIFVGTGTCGIAAGAGQTLVAVEAYLKKNQLDADIVEVGCIGLCSAEPLLDFQTPGKARVSFQKVNHSKVETILDECFHNHISGSNVLGQVRNDEHEYWENIPIINDLPFFKKQKRVLLFDCGEIAPNSIDEYMAREGYMAFVKTILNYPPEMVCNMIGQS